MYEEIRFPHLGIVLEHVGKSIDGFGFSIAYYGIIIAAGMMAAMLICTSLAKKAGLDEDSFFNTVILGIVLSVLGARIYYVFFSWDQYKDNLLDIFNIREGGLAIYGGVITAVLVMWIYSRRKIQRDIKIFIFFLKNGHISFLHTFILINKVKEK